MGLVGTMVSGYGSGSSDGELWVFENWRCSFPVNSGDLSGN